ncbi:hypothetical protein IFM12275_41260 [Nocardia sputorum]|nr:MULTISPECIES: hypothetical protein [Nocardia]BDT94150.1 hypothetical protein IFM12275_41260 [Nocardia sputorum]
MPQFRFKLNVDDADGEKRALGLLRRVIAARDDFFDFVSTLDVKANRDDSTLYSYLFEWVDHVYHQMEQDWATRLYIDPEANKDELFRQFLNLVPTIYVAVFDEYLRDPSKLDLIERDPSTNEESRTTRRVTAALPAIDASYFDAETGDSSPVSDQELRERAIAHLIVGCSDTWPLLGYRTPPPPNVG